MEADEVIDESSSKNLILVGGAILALATAIGIRKLVSAKLKRSESDED